MPVGMSGFGQWNRSSLWHDVIPLGDRSAIPYDGFQSPATGPASGRVSPESHDAIVTISAWS